MMERNEFGLSVQAQSGNTVKVSVTGRLDSSNADDTLAKLSGVAPESTVIMDLSGLDYISSAGIRILIILAKRHKNRFTILRPSTFVSDVLASTGITQIIPILTDEQDVKIEIKPGFRVLLEKNKERLFAVYNGKSYTYSDADRISDIIAADLLQLGVRKNSHVAIISSESLNLVCTFLAIQKLGAIAVMMNPACTVPELVNLIREGDVTHICHEMDDAVAAALEKPVYYIGADVDFKAQLSETIQPIPYSDNYDPDDPCVMIFTSGSTGIPKGALHSFYSLQNGAQRVIDAMRLTADDRLCHTMPMFHIGALTLNFMSAILTGASLYYPKFVPGSNILERMECILDTIETYQCTILNAISTSLLSICGLPSFSQERIRSLRFTCTGAMPITVPQMTLIRNHYPNSETINLYGMTEVLPATYVSSSDTWDHLAYTVGKPVEDVDVMIVSADGQSCPAGKTGEICIKANQSMACYYKMDLEKQPLNDSGYIKSGDLGFLDEDGYLHIAGRIKDIIIRGGENIVPGEVEAAIASMEEISNVCVCGVPDEMMGEKVAAAVVLKDGYVLDLPSFKKTMSGKIARHKIPSFVMQLDAFPLLPNTKTDKVTLKKMLTEFSRSK